MTAPTGTNQDTVAHAYVGDPLVPSLKVDPFGSDTVATVDLVDPDDGVVPLTVTSPDGNENWAGSIVQLGEPGEWHLRWVVTGTGRGQVDQTIYVQTAPGYSPPGFTYASTGDMARYTGQVLPTDVKRKLIMASREIARLTRSATYETTVAGLAVHQPTRQALADATCELLAWWEETGTQTGAIGMYQSTSIGPGGVTLSGFTGGASGSKSSDDGRVGPQVFTILMDAGLLARGPYTYG